ncbi:MAG: anti-sigma regulatory factor [Cyanobacteria bacterium]|nr:anti-sigma regulatory factor [Cyanobacteriota bacterium]MDW8202880.1 anti-sigma regulatory factor [Cyanobacteriota bacterium SKYGB_h_bin112]
MIAISRRPIGRIANTVSFASTLYLCPVLDVLVAEVPERWRSEIRLGLQEALVNAVKHGNKLDPGKLIRVNFSVVERFYWWVITNQGQGFTPPAANLASLDDYLPCCEQECGRGLFILYQIFDEVQWNDDGTQLTLGKQLHDRFRFPLIS